MTKKILQHQLGFYFLICKMRRLDLILVKVPSSSRFLWFEKLDKELTKFISVHFIPSPTCPVTYSSTLRYFSISFLSLVGDFPGASRKTPLMRSRRLARRNSVLTLGSPGSLLWVPQPHLCASCNPPRKPISQALAVNFPETFLPADEKVFQRRRGLGAATGLECWNFS